MDQLCKVANPARGHLNGENGNFPVFVRAGEFGLGRRVRPSRSVPVCSFSTHRLAESGNVNPEFVGSRKWLTLAFNAEYPPAQGW